MNHEDATVWSGYFGPWLSGISRPVNGFRWLTAEGWKYDDPQFRWKHSPADDGPWLVPVDGPNAAVEPVDVLNDPRRMHDPTLGRLGLPRAFAALADGREVTRQKRVLDFANRFGFLGHYRVGLFREHGNAENVELKDAYAQGESWPVWEDAIFEAAAIVALWDRVQKRDLQAIRPLVKWNYRPYATVNCMYRRKRPIASWDFGRYIGDYDEWRGGAGTILRPVELEECAGPPEPWAGDPIEAARQAVYDHVRFRLDGQVSTFRSREAAHQMWLIPRTLHAAIYVHLDRELSGRERLPIECGNPRCGRTFFPERRSAKYCSTACRQQANYYKGKADA